MSLDPAFAGRRREPRGESRHPHSTGWFGDDLEYLLAEHRPDSTAAKWLATGATVSAATADIPSARVLSPVHVQQLAAELRHIQPDDLIAHYNATALDGAQIYPVTWQAWEEDFDPLGQVLEHYSFLQQFSAHCATAGAALCSTSMSSPRVRYDAAA